MLWLALALALELSTARVPQGGFVRVKASSAATSIQWNDRTLPLFADPDGSKYGLVPIPALQAPGPQSIAILDAAGRVLERASFDLFDARFRTQNVRLGASVQELKPAPGEMETVAALRKTVSPVRQWSEPFARPTAGCLTSPYGVLRLHNGKPTGSYHGGLDQRGAEGVAVRAIADGTVRIARKFNIHGDTIGIDHGQGVTSLYLHLSKFATAEGTAVRKGEVIGYVGTTGRSTAPHLHWSLNIHGTPVNPAHWVKIQPCRASAPARPRSKRRR